MSRLNYFNGKTVFKNVANAIMAAVYIFELNGFTGKTDC